MSPPSSEDLARTAYAERRWGAALEAFTGADQSSLSAADLESWSTAAFLIGRETVGVDALTRAHEMFLAAGDILAAARCAGWLGMHLMDSGDQARSAGWFARAQRLTPDVEEPSSMAGFVLVPDALRALYRGEADLAEQTFEKVAAFAQQFDDPDLVALARLGQGQAKVMLGQSAEGFTLLDEAMVAVTAGEVSPIPSGIVYCAVIGFCHLAFDLRRAQEWTVALDHWCDEQHDLVAFSGQCYAHRAELFKLHGAWPEALAAAKAAEERHRLGDRDASWGAYYQRAEVQRLQGEFELAQESYRTAGQSGFEPQPGLALLHLAQGKTQLAQSLIRRSLDEADPATRRHLLPAAVEIELAAGDAAAARTRAEELVALSRVTPLPMLEAVADFAEGAVLLDEGDPGAAVGNLRRAVARWRRLDAPYELARSLVLLGRAHRTMGDEESATTQFDAAREIFLGLGANPALAALRPLFGTRLAGPLSPRELEVLRLVSAGLTNRAIAGELFLSEKTVARHMSNIFVKLGLSSRAAATAYAYENKLV